MSNRYSEQDVLATVAPLTRKQLVSFVQAEIVVPLQSESGPVYCQMDIARIELLCELSEQFDLQDEALGMVISLIDQLHGVRAELRTVLAAVESEQAEVRSRIGAIIFQARTGR
jgi:chaperone modulatory protein CbpM